MPPLIRVILVLILTTILIKLLGNTELLHGGTIVVLSVLASYNLITSYRRSTILAYIVSSFLTATLLGTHYSVAWSEVGILITTMLLTLVFIDALIDNFFPMPEVVALLATILVLPLISGLWWVPNVTPAKAPVVGATPEQRKFNRIVQASGAAHQEQTKQELERRFGTYDSATWQNGLGSMVPETGPWPLHIFFPELTDDGNALTQAMWGKRVDDLRVLDTEQGVELEALLGCRMAIRSLLLPTVAGTEKYTPFFQAEDFGETNNPLGALGDKIYQWTSDAAHQKVLTTNNGCDIRPGPAATLLTWLHTCVVPIGGELENNPNLQQIKTFAMACGMVKFVDN